MRAYDHEGDEIIRACACARILHNGNGGIVRKLQVALARVCKEYAKRHSGMVHEAFLSKMVDDIGAKAAEIVREVE